MSRRQFIQGAIIIGLVLAITVTYVGLIQLPTQSTTPTLMPTSTVLVLPSISPAPTHTYTPAPILQGFQLSAQQTELVADGITITSIFIETTHADFVGQTLILSVAGGGTLSQTDVILSGLSTPLSVTYTTGRATGTIEITGQLTHQDKIYEESLQLNLTTERLYLDGTYDVPISSSPLLIPITYHLHNQQPNQPISGTYRLRVAVVGSIGQLTTTLDGGTYQRVIETIIQPQPISNETVLTVFLSPDLNTNADSVIVTASLLDRSDVEPVRQVIFWKNLSDTIRIVNEIPANPLGVTVNDEVYLWDMRVEQQLCMQVYNQNNVAIVPQAMAISYETIYGTGTTTAQLEVGGEALASGDIRSSEDTSSTLGIPYFELDIPTCITVTSGQSTAGLFHVTAYAERTQIQTQAIILGHQGQITLNQSNASNFIVGDQQNTILLNPNNHTLTAYQISSVERKWVLPMWIPTASIDLTTGTFLVDETQTLPIYPTLFAYHNQQNPASLFMGSNSSNSIWLATIDGRYVTRDVSDLGLSDIALVFLPVQQVSGGQ